MTAPVERVLHRASDLVQALGEQHFFYGALAVAAWGDPRNTRDVDGVIVAAADCADRLLAQAATSGFFFDRERAERDLATSKFTRLYLGASHLDVFLGATPFDREACRRRKLVRILGRDVYVASPEDLVVYKIIAGRPRDISDVESVLVRQKGALSVEYMERWIATIAQDLRRPELIERLDRLLRTRYR